MSARVEFLATLRAGLRAAPAESIEEIVADYAAHFDEGLAANRSDTEIAAALGDPLALADELRMELRVDEFEAAPSAGSAARVVAGVIAMGAINTFALCVGGPLLVLLALGASLVTLIAAAAGVWFLLDGASLGLPGGTGTLVLCGLGLLSAAISMAALMVLGAGALVSGLARYMRLHYRFLTRSSTGTP